MLVCPRCKRTNPAEAAYCYFDGADLRAQARAAGAATDGALARPFQFPSGRVCKDLRQLELACQDEWEVARDLLQKGALHKFFENIRRPDLARAAQAALEQDDPDLALDTFLSAIASAGEEKPRLELNPRRLDLGTMHVGESRVVRVVVSNQGKGVLHGKVQAAEDCTWLQLPGTLRNGCTVKTAQSQAVQVLIDTRGLQSPNKYASKLTVITNGGIVEVPARLDIDVVRFAAQPFTGVASPRELAERMRQHPRAAAPFLENGDIARWFAANGWNYPVVGPSAQGIAAVQQFFEGMGLSKAPIVELEQNTVVHGCTKGERPQGRLLLRTTARKWIYARADCNAPWLRLPRKDVGGPQQAVLPYEIDSSALASGSQHQAEIRILTNGARPLMARIALSVEKAVPEATSANGVPGQGILAFAMCALILRLLLAVPCDLLAGVGSIAGASEAGADAVFQPLDSATARNLVIMMAGFGGAAGTLALWRRGDRRIDFLLGGIAGMTAGMILGVTLISAVPVLEMPGSSLFVTLQSGLGWPSVSTPNWLRAVCRFMAATAAWTVLGALAGWLLRLVGGFGVVILETSMRCAAWAFGHVGLQRIGRWFAEGAALPAGPS